VAARLGISRAHCYRLATRGLLPVLELGRRKVVPAEWLQRWLDDRYEDLAASEIASAE
jgi:excisionase family DNA binding protein